MAKLSPVSDSVQRLGRDRVVNVASLWDKRRSTRTGSRVQPQSFTTDYPEGLPLVSVGVLEDAPGYAIGQSLICWKWTIKL